MHQRLRLPLQPREGHGEAPGQGPKKGGGRSSGSKPEHSPFRGERGWGWVLDRQKRQAVLVSGGKCKRENYPFKHRTMTEEERRARMVRSLSRDQERAMQSLDDRRRVSVPGPKLFRARVRSGRLNWGRKKGHSSEG